MVQVTGNRFFVENIGKSVEITDDNDEKIDLNADDLPLLIIALQKIVMENL